MSKECETARNVVVTTIIVLMSILMFCSSCSSTQNTCAAYASIEVKKWNEMKKVITVLLVMFALQSCGTWKFVEPMAPNSANNHRYNR